MSDSVRPADYRVAACAAMPPGADMLAALRPIDPGSLDLADRVTVLDLMERSRHVIDAGQQRLLASLEYGDARDEEDWIREEVAAALRLSPTTAASRLEVARGLVERFPNMLGLLETGEVAYGHARALVEETQHLDDAAAARVEHRVLGKAGWLAVGRFRLAVQRTAAAVDPATPAERHTEARQERRLWKKIAPDGMALLGQYLPAEQVAVCWNLVDEAAHRDGNDPDDDRTVDQRRADAFVDLLTGTRPGASGSGTDTVDAGPTVSVEVVVSADTLAGGSGVPGELVGFGPITAEQVTALAYSRNAAWRRIVTDPGTGRLVACGEKTYLPGDWRKLFTDPLEPVPPPSPSYRPPPRLARFVETRDRICAFPGCRRRARRCDLDHRIPWPEGATCAENLHPLCRRHHRVKHRAGWQLRNNPDGSWTWISPLGREYTEWPPDQCDD